MLKMLKKMNDKLSSRKGTIICGVLVIIAIGGLMGQRVYKAKEAAKVAAIQAAKEDAEIKKARDLYAKQKADAEAKRLADLKAIEDAKAAELESQIVRVNRPVEAIYEEIHTMANTIVIASVIRGLKEITKENIFALSNEIQKADYDADVKTQLLAILQRWNAGHFSQADYDHNYVWEKLGGDEGRATGVDTSKLPSWAIK